MQGDGELSMMFGVVSYPSYFSWRPSYYWFSSISVCHFSSVSLKDPFHLFGYQKWTSSFLYLDSMVWPASPVALNAVYRL